MPHISTIIGGLTTGKVPLQYPVVRYLGCLDTRYMVAKPEPAIQRMTQLLEKLRNLKQKSTDDCDAIIR